MLRVWGRKNSSNVQKVVWCLAELGVPYERKDVGGPFGGLDTPQYLAMNPNKRIPTIEDDGLVLWESNAIVRYIATRYGMGTLCPSDPKSRALADRWMDWQITTIAPAVGPIFMQLIRTPAEKRSQAAIDAAIVEANANWPIFDAHLAKNHFAGGENFTMGDIPLGIMAYRWYTLVPGAPKLAHLEAWYDRLKERPAFREHVMFPLS
jgi:glutathione S-transferase